MDVLLPANANSNSEDLVKYYFGIRPKLKYNHICTLINEHHGVPLTMRQLLQICKKSGFSRKRNVDDDVLYSMIQNELGKENT